jgi:hypothetical protein
MKNTSKIIFDRQGERGHPRQFIQLPAFKSFSESWMTEKMIPKNEISVILPIFKRWLLFKYWALD